MAINTVIEQSTELVAKRRKLNDGRTDGLGTKSSRIFAPFRVQKIFLATHKTNLADIRRADYRSRISDSCALCVSPCWQYHFSDHHIYRKMPLHL